MRGRPRSIREETILDAARDVFRAEGHAATTAEIARRAGVSEGILFYRYKTKEALLAAAIARESAPSPELLAMWERAGKGSLAENLEMLIESVLETVERVHPLFELAISSPASQLIRDALLTTAPKPAPERMVDAIAHFLDAETKHGRLRAIDTRVTGATLFGAVVEFVRSRQFAAVRIGRTAFVRGFADLLMNGMAIHTPRKKRG
ncbi:MAG TPA: helix-turn-helix domain-containing protein [Thermoanaerobaculia bacterium]|nr:helix-turn-helix domain-containing protein [Thermoanaerobaculia bacterium]